ncbi:MAG: hypothetical protein ACOZIN_20395 [Myxococcota bacterium]
MRFALLATLLFAGSLWGTHALAQRQAQEFKEPARMSEEELEAAKQASKQKFNAYQETMEEKPEPFPWAFATLVALAFVVAMPFALRTFKSTAAEISAHKRAPPPEP